MSLTSVAFRNVCLILLTAFLFLWTTASAKAENSVSVVEGANFVVLSNQNITLRVEKSTARIRGLKRKSDGLELVTPPAFGYLNLAWKPAGSNYRVPLQPLIERPQMRVLHRGPQRAEVSFFYPATERQPLEIELHFVLFADTPGVYLYGKVRHPAEAAPVDLHNLDWLQRANADLFDYRFLHDKLQGDLWPIEDLRFKTKENELINETFRFPDGRLWAKHMWKNNDLLSPVFGYSGAYVGLWSVIPNYESFGGIRPLTENSIVHETVQGPVMSVPMENNYYGRGPTTLRGEWSKIHGPFLLYVNAGASRDALWADAKKRAAIEAAQWPYPWVEEPLFEKKRGQVKGQLKIMDGSSPQEACVILGDPDSPWQQHQSPYLFWAYANQEGAFAIPKVRPGRYTLYAFVPGVMGEFRRDDIEVKDGQSTELGLLNWTPVRHGQLLWQIGKPDRGALEFKNGPGFRQWDNFLRYRQDFPHDVNFVIGQSREGVDWHYLHPAQVQGESRPVVWKIQFDLRKPPAKQAVLTFAIASTRAANVGVLVNDLQVGTLLYPYTDARDSIDSIGIRAGMYGRYHEQVLRFPSSHLKMGRNTISLRPQGRLNWLSYIIYDCVRLEAAD